MKSIKVNGLSVIVRRDAIGWHAQVCWNHGSISILAPDLRTLRQRVHQLTEPNKTVPFEMDIGWGTFTIDEASGFGMIHQGESDGRATDDYAERVEALFREQRA